MKAVLRFVLRNVLAGAIFGITLALVLHWLDSKPKLITVAFNGWHGKDYLAQRCIVLQRDFDHFRALPANTQVALMSLTNKSHMPCLRPADEMYRGIENQIISSFATNPQCHGISFSQGFYDPKTDATTEAGQKWLAANWRLSLDLTASAETGEVSLEGSEWTLNPKIVNGSLANIDQASTAICTAVKGAGGQL